MAMVSGKVDIALWACGQVEEPFGLETHDQKEVAQLVAEAYKARLYGDAKAERAALASIALIRDELIEVGVVVDREEDPRPDEPKDWHERSYWQLPDEAVDESECR